MTVEAPVPDHHHLSELLGEVVRDAQQRLAEQQLAASEKANPSRKRRAAPPPYVDLTPYLGMKDADIVRALGQKSDVSHYTRFVKVERHSGMPESAPDGRPRCQAGVAVRLNLRCGRGVLDGERWCRQHHPDPPVGPHTIAEVKQDRVARQQLWQRPDGRVLEGLYALTDVVEDLVYETRAVLQRAERLEAASKESARDGWLNADQAAEYTGRSRSAVSQAALVGRLAGVRETPRSSWAFKAADLDAWMISGASSNGHYREQHRVQRRPRSR